MFKKNDVVKVLPYTRTKTIFNNAEVSPGETVTYSGGWIGKVTGIFDGTPGPDIIEVQRGQYTDNVYDFSPDELELFEPDDLITQAQAVEAGAPSVQAVNNAIRDGRLYGWQRQNEGPQRQGATLVSLDAIKKLWPK